MTELGVSMRALGAGIDVPCRSLQNYLCGTSRMPADVFEDACNQFDVDIQYICEKHFGIRHSLVWDEIRKVFGSGILDFQLKPNATEAGRGAGPHTKKQEIAGRAATELCEA